MKAISKAAASVFVIASLLGGGAAVAVASTGTPPAHPAPQAVSALEYAL